MSRSFLQLTDDPSAPQAVPELLELPRSVYFRTYLLAKDDKVEHQHPFVEFLYARRGDMWVKIEGKAMIVPVLYGVWIPANTLHCVQAINNVQMESLYMGAGDMTSDYNSARVVVVNDFIREFIHYATEHVPENYDDDGADGKLVSVLTDLLKKLPDAGFSLSWPHSAVLMRVCHEIQQTPDKAHGIAQWASRTGMSVRTFSRHFKKETGLSFSEWKRRMRLLDSVVMLKNHRSVTQVALDLGYSSTASFTYAFRQMFGVPPTRY